VTGATRQDGILRLVLGAIMFIAGIVVHVAGIQDGALASILTGVGAFYLGYGVGVLDR
jgi:hypothetical protein